MLALQELTQFIDRNISSVFATHLKPKSRAFLNISRHRQLGVRGVILLPAP